MGDTTTLHRHALRKASTVLGGEEELAARLGLAVGTVRMMMNGRLGVPQRVFLQAIDIISAQDATVVHPSARGENIERRED